MFLCVYRCAQQQLCFQAVVSAVSMVAVAGAQADAHPLPQMLLVQAPADMRSQVRCLLCHPVGGAWLSAHMKTKLQCAASGGMVSPYGACPVYSLNSLTVRPPNA